MYPMQLVGYVFVLWLHIGSVVNAAEKPMPNIELYFNGTAINHTGIDLREKEIQQITFYWDDLPLEEAKEIHIEVSSTSGLCHAEVLPSKLLISNGHTSAADAYVSNEENGTVKGTFNITGTLLGFSKIKLFVTNGTNDILEGPKYVVKVQRGDHVLDLIFIHILVALVIVAYINMGCAIDPEIIRTTLKKPIAPAIGLASQYIFMPLVSFGLGYLLFAHDPPMWLGLFLAGCAPGGAGSNMWTYLMGGSLDLSITMTFISTVAAFGALPLWVYGLAPHIFSDGEFSNLPYKRIGVLVACLVIPIGIGMLIRRFSERTAAVLKKLLKPISVIFIVFIMTFGVYANLYMFSFFSWKVVLGGFCLPFLGFIFGCIISLLMKRPVKEIIAISIETGIQNTGLAIGILKVALAKYAPLGDVTIVVPVAVATMTPLPLLIICLGKRIWKCRQNSNMKVECEDCPLDDDRELNDNEIVGKYKDLSKDHNQDSKN